MIINGGLNRFVKTFLWILLNLKFKVGVTCHMLFNKLLAEAGEAKKVPDEKEKREAYDNKSMSDEVKASYTALDCDMVGIGFAGKAICSSSRLYHWVE